MPSALPSKTVALLVPKVTLNFMSTFQTKELFSIHHHVINLKPNPPPQNVYLFQPRWNSPPALWLPQNACLRDAIFRV